MLNPFQYWRSLNEARNERIREEVMKHIVNEKLWELDNKFHEESLVIAKEKDRLENEQREIDRRREFILMQRKELVCMEAGLSHMSSLYKDSWRPFTQQIELDSTQRKDLSLMSTTTKEALSALCMIVQRDLSNLSVQQNGEEHFRLMNMARGAGVFMQHILDKAKAEKAKDEKKKENKSEILKKSEEEKPVTYEDIVGIPINEEPEKRTIKTHGV